MKHFNKLLLLFALTSLSFSAMMGQERYLDEIFTDVNVEPNVVYANNITVLNPTAIGPEDLKMDIYTADGDTATNRPVVIYWHTGSFLPAIINGQVTGSKEDSTCAEICRRLARQGYVAISATYRLGWNPTALGAEGQDIRTGTLLNAAYRGVQDARAAIRFLRKTVAEDSNPYGIDPEKITLWGQGTGGYISYAAAYLNDYSEIVLDKFIGANLEVYVDSALSADVYGLNQRPLNLPNHVGYSSDFALAVNCGGALGDTSWVDGTAEEPPTIGFHVFADPFAPYLEGAVVVPVTGDFVVNVAGTRRVTEVANDKGLNAVFEDANNDMTDPINLINKAYSATPAQTIFGQPLSTLSVDNMYPFLTDTVASGPWEWWGFPQLEATVDFLNQALGRNDDPAVLDANNRILNPDASKEKAMAYIDTMMAYFNPRAYLALNLATATNTHEILTAEEVALAVAPNPVNEVTFIQTAPDQPMERIALYHMNGKMLRGVMNVNSSTYNLNRGNLPPGVYVLQIEVAKGIVTKKLVFN